MNLLSSRLFWAYLMGMSFPTLVLGQFSLDLLSTQSGLSGNRTRTVSFASTGEVWIGTQNGLNLYNGYEVSVFQRSPQQAYSLPDNFIHTTVTGPGGQVWIGTARAGICRYDPVQAQFHPLTNLAGEKLLSDLPVKSICLPNDTTLWVGTSRGLYLCKLTRNFVVRRMVAFKHHADNPNSLARGMIMDIVQTDPYTVWAGTYHQGLCRIQLGTDTLIQRFTYTPAQPYSLKHDYLHRLFIDRHGRLWIGTNGGAFFLSKEQIAAPSPRFQRISSQAYDTPTPHEGTVNDFAEDPQGQLWFISNHYLHHYLPETGSVKSFSFAELGAKSSGANIFMRFGIDRDNRFWICSMEGIYYSKGYISGFTYIPVSSKSSEDPPLVRAIAIDSFGFIWIGTEAEGVQVLDQADSVVLRLTEEAGELQSNFVTEILCDRQGRVWLALFGGGLYRLTVKRDAAGKPIAFEAKHFEPPQLDQRDVEDIIEDHTGTIWLASLRGLSRWSADSQRFYTYPMRWGTEVVPSSTGDIWLATSMGLFAYDSAGDSLRRFEAHATLDLNLAKQMFLCTWPDTGGWIWAGTPHGLYHLHPDGAAQLYREEDGLAGNLIQVLQGDQEGNLWIGTQKGLSCWQADQQRFINYYHEDGIRHRHFADRASTIGENGQIYVGGDQGVIRVSTRELRFPTRAPKPILTSVKLFNQALSLHWAKGREGNRLPQSPPFLTNLPLHYREKSFTLEFAAPAHGQTHRLIYRTRLIGFSSQWQALPLGSRSLTFTNLDPGKYMFDVQASLDGIHWSANTRLNIDIAPPWYRRWWAWLTYAFAIAGLIVAIFMVRVRKIEQEYATQNRIREVREEERESVRKRSARDFHDEAGNKLTKLALYTALTKRLLPEGTQAAQYLDQIERNLAALSSGMRDFIWVLNPEHDSLADTLKRIVTFGNELFEDSQTIFQSQLPLTDLEGLSLNLNSKRHLLLIFKEAMNNTLKYAQASYAEMEVKMVAGTLYLTYSDNGVGFELTEVKKGQGLRNMESRAEEIGMEFTISSVPGEGTRIQVQLDITHMGYSES